MESHRPSKRARPNPPPAQTQTLSHSIPLPKSYSRAQPITFQQPSPLTSFSYSSTNLELRELLLKERSNEALAVYKEPPKLGIDLNVGFEECIWRDGEIDEGLDSLLLSLLSWSKDDSTGLAKDLFSRTHIITWRGMLSKILTAVYEVENEFDENSTTKGRKNRGDSWEMNGMVIDGVLYLEDANSPEKLKKKKSEESNYLRQAYYGYSFESYSTHSMKSTRSPIISSQSPESNSEFSIPNTNVQWCSIIKTNLGGFRTILGGEVDCITPGQEKGGEIDPKHFIELKTNIIIESQRDEIMFERQKLLKHYIQSFLLGVPKIIVGFRTRPGILTALQSFKTMEIPRLVRNKAHSWDPNICLAAGKELLTFIHKNIGDHPNTLHFQSLYDQPSSSSTTSISSDEEGELKLWPIFRIRFEPNAKNGQQVGNCSIRLLDEIEVEEEVLRGKSLKKRVGFLLKEWVEECRSRKIEMMRKEQASANGRGGIQR